MIWLFLSPFLLIFLTLALIFIPRIKFSASFNHEASNFTISNLWLHFYYNFRQRTYSGRIFLFIIPVKKYDDKEPFVSGKSTEDVDDKTVYDDTAAEDEPEPEEETADAPVKKRPEFKKKLSGIKFKRRTGKTEKQEDRESEKSISWREMLEERGLFVLILKKMVRGAVRLFKSLRIDIFDADLTIATPDPAWTGVCFGIVQPLNLLNRFPRSKVKLSADFDRETPDAELACAVSVRPVTVMLLGFWTLLTLPWIRIWKFYRKYFRKKKQKSETDE